jgi:anti-anti-sigma regulatory factor
MDRPSTAEDRPADSSQSHYLVATSEEVVYARVMGLGTMSNSVPLKQFFEGLKGRGYRKFVVDLSACGGFDSTFMGVLLGLALAEAVVVLVNVRDEHRRLLQEVGLHRLVEVCPGPISLPQIAMARLDAGAVKAEERIRVMLAAHENLVRIDRRNEEKFGAFIQALRQELGEDSGL